MRCALIAGLTLLAVPAIGLAQTGPYFATVTDPEVKLRSGPSDKYPETATLVKGAQLIVVKEESNGWLAVSDPPGKLYSMSWVPASFVNDYDNNKPIPQPITVEEEATLAAGQIGLAQPSHIRLTKVPAGVVFEISNVAFLKSSGSELRLGIVGTGLRVGGSHTIASVS